ncbi:hypothetical protein ACQVTI_15820 [Bacillus cereus]|nr:hypothetical protein [Bacillus cereus]
MNYAVDVFRNIGSNLPPKQTHKPSNLKVSSNFFFPNHLLLLP